MTCCRLLQQKALLEERYTVLQQQLSASKEQEHIAKELLKASQQVPISMLYIAESVWIACFPCTFACCQS